MSCKIRLVPHYWCLILHRSLIIFINSKTVQTISTQIWLLNWRVLRKLFQIKTRKLISSCQESRITFVTSLFEARTKEKQGCRRDGRKVNWPGPVIWESARPRSGSCLGSQSPLAALQDGAELLESCLRMGVLLDSLSQWVSREPQGKWHPGQYQNSVSSALTDPCAISSLLYQVLFMLPVPRRLPGPGWQSSVRTKEQELSTADIPPSFENWSGGICPCTLRCDDWNNIYIDQCLSAWKTVSIEQRCCVLAGRNNVERKRFYTFDLFQDNTCLMFLLQSFQNQH